MHLEFFIPGKPRGKASVRMYRGNFYIPESTKNYMSLVGANAYTKMRSQSLECTEKPVSVRINAHFKNSSTCKPDADNIAKIILDGMTGVVYKDDKQVSQLEVLKTVARDWGVSVTVKDIE